MILDLAESRTSRFVVTGADLADCRPWAQIRFSRLSEILTTKMHQLMVELLAAPFCSLGLILFVQRSTPFRP